MIFFWAETPDGWGIPGIHGPLAEDELDGYVQSGVYLIRGKGENLLVDSLPGVSRYAPGVLGRAITGQQTGTLHTPALAALLLVLYAAAAAAAAAGWPAITRRDVD